MRIVSLLPSATEIVFALGLGDQLDGVTFECDHPAEARSKTVVSGTALPAGLTDPAEIDRLVTQSMAVEQPIYTLDAERIRTIRPDLILAQDLCRVCAVPSGHVEDALDQLGCTAEVLSLDPNTLDDVIACIGQVGQATGTTDTANQLMRQLSARVDAVRTAVANEPRRRLLAIEWADPPFTGGHWVPEMIQAAGATSLLADRGQRSRKATWQEIEQTGPDVVLFIPCGYDLEQAKAQSDEVLRQPALASVDEIWVADATSYFSRPGPRVVDGVEALAWALHPNALPEPPSNRIERLR
ncbi:MAG TPA: cobalamin-binding protein [Acidimicrobiales bacterium]|nr:cobalamin-binding protein [Acidimicrobiales bacterium]